MINYSKASIFSRNLIHSIFCTIEKWQHPKYFGYLFKHCKKFGKTINLYKDCWHYAIAYRNPDDFHSVCHLCTMINEKRTRLFRKQNLPRKKLLMEESYFIIYYITYFCIVLFFCSLFGRDNLWFFGLHTHTLVSWFPFGCHCHYFRQFYVYSYFIVTTFAFWFQSNSFCSKSLVYSFTY